MHVDGCQSVTLQFSNLKSIITEVWSSKRENQGKMVRKLKYHEQKLLKKVDFISWKADNYNKENAVLAKYHIQKRDDYTR